MALVQHTVTVDAPASLVWALLKEKIERPERFVPGARDVEIVRRIDDRAVERVMRIGPPDAPRTVREVISYDDATMTVIFKLVDDPVNVGFVTNTIFEDAGLVKLDFTMRWTRRDGGADDASMDRAAMIRRAVENTRDVCEAAHRAAKV